MPLITVIGWVVFGVTFYVTTQRTLADNKTSIERILSTREKLLDSYNAQMKQLADAISEQSRSSALNHQANGNRMDNMERNSERLEKRVDQMLQALDAQYNALNEHLRSHGSASSVPRR